jgi:SAM-dependent methyltransferase
MTPTSIRPRSERRQASPASARRLRHRVRFPQSGRAGGLDQDEAFFYLTEAGERLQIRLHDYDAIYERPGLYEQLFYERLKCQSPAKVAEVLNAAVRQAWERPSELRVLDFGAGNGMAAEALAASGVARLVGVDIEEWARAATERDRPGLYDQYYVVDLTDLSPEEEEDLRDWHFDCLCCVAALGFGDIPPHAFRTALNLIARDGWVAFNIKDTFLDSSDTSGFSSFIRRLILSEHLDLHHLERYRHRLSIDGAPLYYFAIVARKSCDEVPARLVGEP